MQARFAHGENWVSLARCAGPAGGRPPGLGLARATSRPQAPFDAGVVENAARDLFDRAFRGIDDWNRIPREERIGRAQLIGDLLA